VRTLRPALGSLAVLLLLVFCADSDAGRFCRQRCSNNCCGIPSWVRWVDYDGHTPPHFDWRIETHCFCCQGTKSVSCDGGTINCTSTPVFVSDSNPPPNCGSGGYGGQGCGFHGCTAGWVRLYAMVYDPCTHVLRFARPCERDWHVYGPLCVLGLPPRPHHPN
jgi:hypothetical protein